MKKAVFDNKIWINSLSADSSDLIRVLAEIRKKNLSVLTSKDILDELHILIKSAISSKNLQTKKALTFFKLIPYVFEIQKNFPVLYSLENKRLGIYSDLTIATKAEFLVAYDYDEFDKLDGFQGINVVGIDTFIQNLI